MPAAERHAWAQGALTTLRARKLGPHNILKGFYDMEDIEALMPPARTAVTSEAGAGRAGAGRAGGVGGSGAGAHSRMPSRAPVARGAQAPASGPASDDGVEVEVMTILRHPVERALSLYKFTHNAQRLLPLDREGHWDGKCSG